METLDVPWTGAGANSVPFVVRRQTTSLILKINNTLHKLRFLEIENINVSEAILGMDFLEDFDKYTIQLQPEPNLVLFLRSDSITLPLFSKTRKYMSTFREAVKCSGTRDTDADQDNGLNHKP